MYSVGALIHRSDDLMCAAKRDGKNRLKHVILNDRTQVLVEG